MKKITLTAFTAVLSLSIQAQTVDFESFPLSQADTFYNGADGAAGFSITASGTNVQFENYYDNMWASWYGYSVSNMTDVTTPGYLNQYSAFAGSGSNSSNYGVMYSTGEINFGKYVQLDSVKITNTTYAALSMMNGDAYAKVFGSPNDANGNPDGTNGEDFLRIWIFALDENNQHLDSMEYYLADYRFSDNNLDYLVQAWENLDLSALDPAYKLNFTFECSDMAFGYINQPTYFAFDNLTFHPTLSTEKLNADLLQIYPNPVQDRLYVKGMQGEISISDLSGKMVFTASHSQFSSIDLSFLNQGAYVLSVKTDQGVHTQTLLK